MIKIFIKKISENVLLSTTYFLIGLLAIGGFFYYRLTTVKYALETSLAQAEAKLKASEEQINSLKNENGGLATKLAEEESRVNDLAEKVGGITSTVGTLEKLSKTDKELLQKYSKVYFLNEHYLPENLSDVPEKLLVNKDKITKIHTNVLPYLEKMAERASEDKVNLRIISTYRSFDEQSSLKTSYKFTYGAGTANKFSADQGYSEHQLGTAIDFSTDTLGLNFSAFETTNAYAWLSNNAYKFGFIISYPKKNTYYQFEPWHWRFVGVALAKTLHEKNQNFYDMDQREIDSYLVNIFD